MVEVTMVVSCMFINPSIDDSEVRSQGIQAKIILKWYTFFKANMHYSVQALKPRIH